MKSKRDYKILFFVIFILFIGFGILFIRYHSRQSEPPPLNITPSYSNNNNNNEVSHLKKSALIAIIIDDFGYSLNANVKGFIELDYPITLAILPRVPYSKDIALLAEMVKKEVILHLPMEPYGYPQKNNPGEGAILCNLSTDEIRKRVIENLADLPQVVGLNIHMGSKASEDMELMAAVLDEVKDKGIYFIDSLTSKNSCGLKLAEEKGIRKAGRDIFLDNKDDPVYINKQFDKLIIKAKKEGSAIGIGHIYKSTLDVLRDRLPHLESEGVKIVFASEIVK